MAHRRKRPYQLLLLSFLFILGCAPAVPPPVPVALAVSDSPPDFRWEGVRWAPGMRLRYSSETFQEVRMGDRVLAPTTNRQTAVMAVGERNAKGLLRLRLSFNGIDVAELYVGQRGELEDLSLLLSQLSSDDAEVIEQMVTQMARDPVLRHFGGATLALDARAEAEIPLLDLAGAFLKPASPPAPKLRVSISYAGQRLLDGRRAIEVRVSAMLPRGRHRFLMRGQPDVVTVNSVDADGVSYVDPAKGFTLRNYSTMILDIQAKGQRITAKIISSLSLDLAASEGI